VVLLVLLLALAVRLLQLQAVDSSDYVQSATGQRIVKTAIPAERGAITDRNGSVLATSVEARAVFGDPRSIAKDQKSCAKRMALPLTPTSDPVKPCTPQAIAEALSPVLGVPAADLAAKLSRDAGFVYLGRNLDVAVGNQVSELSLIGIGVTSEPRRDHPAGAVAANVLGFTDTDGKGAGGAELGFDQLLSGTPGKTTRQVDGGGRTIPSAGETQVAAVPGTGVQLTIDRDLQWYAQQVLAQKVAQTQALNGTAVVMDVQTGQILALATAPTFDANTPGKAQAQDLGNPAISEVYEPGSVTKIVTAAAALEAGVVNPDTPIADPDTYQVGKHTVHDAEPHAPQTLTFTGVMVKSSNVGTVQVAQLLGEQRVHDALAAFGFGSKTGLGLPGESRGVLPDVKDWSATSIATIPIGQGVSATAVQVASVYQTVANNGVRVTPSIVKGTIAPDGSVTPAAAPTSTRVISEATAKQLQTMLEGVVTAEGTAPLAAIPGYRIAGKTGTAQRAIEGQRGYAAGHYTSSFVGFAPADAPRLVTAIVLQDTGKAGYFGGAVAGPVFKDVMGFALRSLQVPPTMTTPPTLRLKVG
jgi:cell division protein FtsI (penicillin-binding protein 3)